MDMVRQSSRRDDLYTKKMAKATDTPSGFSSRVGSPGERQETGYVQSLRQQGRTLKSAGAAASKGSDLNLPPSV